MQGIALGFRGCGGLHHNNARPLCNEVPAASHALKITPNTTTCIMKMQQGRPWIQRSSTSDHKMLDGYHLDLKPTFIHSSQLYTTP